ncbi:hypothetical protein WDU94_004366 [Cyamophila willieti]
MAGVRTHDTSHTVRLYSTLQHPRLLVFRLSEGKIVFYKYDVGSMTLSRASEHRTCNPWVGSFEVFRIF